MKIGFIGTGVISDAIIRGLMKSGADLYFLLSKRSQHYSTLLSKDFACVEVLDDNQAIIDQSDVVFLAVRPQVAELVLSGLTIPSDKEVISLIATLTHETLTAWFGNDMSLCRAIPLPFVSDRLGITAIYPDQATTKRLFTLVGTVVVAETQREFDRYGVASATMGVYFDAMATLTSWMVREGTPLNNANAYFNALFNGLNQTALNQPNVTFQEQVLAHCTPKGLNEQAVSVFREEGGHEALMATLDSLKKRLIDS